MGLEDPAACGTVVNPLMETTLTLKICYQPRGGGRNHSNSWFYEGINELFLKISRDDATLMQNDDNLMPLLCIRLQYPQELL